MIVGGFEIEWIGRYRNIQERWPRVFLWRYQAANCSQRRASFFGSSLMNLMLVMVDGDGNFK